MKTPTINSKELPHCHTKTSTTYIKNPIPNRNNDGSPIQCKKECQLPCGFKNTHRQYNNKEK